MSISRLHWSRSVPGKNGRYRVEVHGDGEVWVIVQKGEAEIASTEGVEVLKKGKRMIVRAGQEKDESEFIITNTTPRDEWDEWNERPRQESAEIRELPLRQPEHLRSGRPRRSWALGLRSPLRELLVPISQHRLGSLPLRRVALHRLLRLDLGQPRALGLGSLSLRPLVPSRDLRLGLVSGRILQPSLLASRAGCFLRLRLWYRVWCRRALSLPSRGLGSARAG